jgi:hypothetical protein
MFEELKIISAKKTRSIKKENSNIGVAFSFKNQKRILINIYISPAKMIELGWNTEDKILVYSDGKKKFGLLPDASNSAGYTLRKRLSVEDKIIGYDISFSWNASICEKMDDLVINDDSSSQKYLASQILENGLLIILP